MCHSCRAVDPSIRCTRTHCVITANTSFGLSRRCPQPVMQPRLCVPLVLAELLYRR